MGRQWSNWGGGASVRKARETPRGWSPPASLLAGLSGEERGLLDAAIRFKRRCELAFAADWSLRAGAQALIGEARAALGGEQPGGGAWRKEAAGVALIVAGALLAYLDLAEWGDPAAADAPLRAAAETLLANAEAVGDSGALREWALACDVRLARLAA